MNVFLDFERPIAELEGKIEDLRQLGSQEQGVSIDDEIVRLQAKVQQLVEETYTRLTPWQKALVARHPGRPHFSNYVARLVTDFTPLAGDRLFGDDKAIITGMGRFRGQPVVIIGHEKGNDTKTRLLHNFGMAMPEGYRKVQRVLDTADRFGLPVISLVDTAGAYPGIGAEERGQAEAIARSTQSCLSIRTPFISVIIGEGGSGGAVAIATANKVLMLEHSIYSVISPEGCASILWRNAEKASDAAVAMKVTAQDLLDLEVIDRIVPEPVGGAHRAPQAAVDAVGDAIAETLEELSAHAPEELRRMRRDKFLQIGKFETA